MKKTFLITALLIFISTISFCITEDNLHNGIGDVINIENIEEDVVIEGLTINIEMGEGGSCTVSVEGSIGWNSTYVKVTVSSTANTCEEAMSQAMGAFKKAKRMIEEL